MCTGLSIDGPFLFFRYQTNENTHHRYDATNYEKKEYPSIDEMIINPIKHLSLPQYF